MFQVQLTGELTDKCKIMAMHTKDQCWHLTVVASVAYGLLSVLTTNSGFMYVGIMEQFNVNREMASWPVSILFIAIQTAGEY